MLLLPIYESFLMMLALAGVVEAAAKEVVVDSLIAVALIVVVPRQMKYAPKGITQLRHRDHPLHPMQPLLTMGAYQ